MTFVVFSSAFIWLSIFVHSCNNKQKKSTSVTEVEFISFGCQTFNAYSLRFYNLKSSVKKKWEHRMTETRMFKLQRCIKNHSFKCERKVTSVILFLLQFSFSTSKIAFLQCCLPHCVNLNILPHFRVHHINPDTLTFVMNHAIKLPALYF